MPGELGADPIDFMVATAILKEGVETFRCNMVVQKKER